MQRKAYLRIIKNHLLQTFAIIWLLVLSSCNKAPDFSTTPHIEFLGISNDVVVNTDLQTSVDSVTIKLNFEDGDGDLGVDASDINNVKYLDFSDTTVSATGDTSYYFVNYYVKMYRKSNGEFVEVIPFSPYGGTFESLVSYDQVGPIEGKLYYGFIMLESDGLGLGFQGNDTIKCDVYIVDRNLNVSNTVTTDEIVVFADL